MRRSIALAAAVTLALVSSAGCATSVVTPTVVAASGAPAAGDPSALPDEDLVAAVNGFGLDLLKETAAEGENTVLSPFSVATALSMTHVGARGTTAKEIAEVLHVSGMDDERLHASWADLIASSATEDETVFRTADSLWTDEDVSFEEPFLDVNHDDFGAEIRTLDLQAPGAADEVNAWVDDATEGLIPEIVTQDQIEGSVLELVNAVYFLGEWEMPFEAESTFDESFTLTDGEDVDVPMMHAMEPWPYTESAEYQAVRMAYKGGTHAAYVIVPKEDSAWEMLDGMDAEWFRTLRDEVEEQDGSVTIPVFELEWGEDLAGPLKRMGMASAFTADADFSGISRQAVETYDSLFISHVLHKTYLRVDEKGTEAAAATSVGIAGSAAPAAEPFELRADKPFVFVLTDERSGTLLFLGVIADPR